ncbi:MAG TPA: PAS domain-containing protein, partial [Vicinamibacterales bacterium]|nr:PAS domain-containing protein [Vicinamibacterales bacterium]
MKKPITARDSERPFAMGELFFSTTDRKGIIRSGNHVFVRVSGHPLDELIGAPHNIIRHPDMPKAVFKLLWDYLGEQKPFAGYVKNLAADGSYYWVMALVVPIDDGYLSIRFKPSSQIFAAVRSLYAEMLATEKKAGDKWRDGMRDATTQLVDALHRLGFADYDDFMHTALATEMTAHQNAARGYGHNARRGNDHSLAAMLASCEQ